MVYAIEINPTTFPAARFTTIGSLLNILLPSVYMIAGLVFLGILFWGAYIWIRASGDPKKLETSHNTLKYALLGIIVIAISYVITKVLLSMFGIDSGL